MYQLNSSCFPVKGYGRSIIYDFGNNKYHYIPNSLCELLTKFKTTEKWMENKTEEEQEILTDYLNFLQKNDCLLNLTNLDADCFSDLSLEWETKEKIAILNLQLGNKSSKYFMQALKEFCIQNQVKNVSIECTCNQENVFAFLNIIQNTFIDNVELYLPHSLYCNCIFEDWIAQYPFISKIVLMGANENTGEYLYSGNQIGIQKIEMSVINSESKPIQFVLNRNFFIEAQSFNVFYNKRLFIDETGNIRTHPNMSKISNIRDNKMSIFDSQCWHIGKNQIHVCKDCEHRYLCYDLRIPVQGKNKEWYYLTGCGYNPYICKWLGQEEYVSLEECGTYSKETGFVPDHERIKVLNQQIWRDE
jgi:hypothetical protein